MDPVLFASVFLIALAGAVMDVMVGGGTLLVVPGLGALGLALHTVIATNRLYIVPFSLVGLANYWRKNVRIDPKPLVPLLLSRVAGAYLGSNAVLAVPVSELKLVVAGFMAAAIVAIILLDRHKEGKIAFLPEGWPRVALACAIFLPLGYYEGFVGGGGGTISRILLMLFLGMPLLQAGVAELLMTVATSATASAVFLQNDQVDFALFVPMLLGGIVGAWIGSHLAVKKGEAWLRPLLFGVVGLLLVKLVFF